MTNERKIVEMTLEEYLAELERNRLNEEWIRKNIASSNLRFFLKGNGEAIAKVFEDSGRFKIYDRTKKICVYPGDICLWDAQW